MREHGFALKSRSKVGGVFGVGAMEMGPVPAQERFCSPAMRPAA